MENVEKPNIFDRELVTIECPKTAIQVSKPTSKKVKIDTESKPADRTLTLDFIKDFILLKILLKILFIIIFSLKKCLQRDEIKIVNSKKNYEQLA